MKPINPWPYIVMLVVVLFLYLVVMTHKVAGPLYKVSRYFDQMAEGKLGNVYALRKGDMLQDFYDQFRGSHDALRKRHIEDSQVMNKFLAACEAVGAEGGGKGAVRRRFDREQGVGVERADRRRLDGDGAPVGAELVGEDLRQRGPGALPDFRLRHRDDDPPVGGDLEEGVEQGLAFGGGEIGRVAAWPQPPGEHQPDAEERFRHQREDCRTFGRSAAARGRAGREGNVGTGAGRGQGAHACGPLERTVL